MTTEDEDYEDVSVLALGVRGYSCQVFDDPQTAWKLHQETHLIAWRGESDGGLRVDRFDARNLLEDRNLFRQLKKRKRQTSEDADTEEKVTTQCTGEDAEDSEQLLHCLRFGDYAVEFPPKEESTENKFPYQYPEDESDRESDGEAFELPWKVPDHIIVPKTKKRHAILEATANKVRDHPQLEVMLKVKLAENAKFRFLDTSHSLHAYYCFLRDENPQPVTKKTATSTIVSLLGEEYSSDSDEEEDKRVENGVKHEQDTDEQRDLKVARQQR